MTARRTGRWSPTGAAILVALALVLAGCGSSAPSDGQVANCLSAALLENGVGVNASSDCSLTDPNLTVACTHQSGNSYVCDVSGAPNSLDGLYSVTDDGHSLAYQQG